MRTHCKVQCEETERLKVSQPAVVLRATERKKFGRATPVDNTFQQHALTDAVM